MMDAPAGSDRILGWLGQPERLRADAALVLGSWCAAGLASGRGVPEPRRARILAHRRHGAGGMTAMGDPANQRFERLAAEALGLGGPVERTPGGRVSAA